MKRKNFIRPAALFVFMSMFIFFVNSIEVHKEPFSLHLTYWKYGIAQIINAALMWIFCFLSFFLGISLGKTEGFVTGYEAACENILKMHEEREARLKREVSVD